MGKEKSGVPGSIGSARPLDAEKGRYHIPVGKVATEIYVAIDEYTSSQTLDKNNFLVIVDASSNITLTLPAATSNTSKRYTIKKIDSSGNKVTIDANGAETIDGELTVVLNLQYQYVTIVCDGDEWFIIGGEYVKIEDLLDKKLGEQIELLHDLRTELRQIKLHQASQSDENIGEEDAQ